MAAVKSKLSEMLLLTVIWVVLCGEFSAASVAVGAAVSFGCVFFCSAALPSAGQNNFRLVRLLIYPFYLLGQIYLAGFVAIKLILTGAETEIVEIETKLTNRMLKTVLANSITLTPGTVSLELNGSKITVLRLVKKTGRADACAGESIKSNLEKKLLAIQKTP